MKILFAGGGTLGPVTPLLALYAELRDQHPTGGLTARWIGTPQGPERGMVESAGLPFLTIHSGKLRRYFDWRNFLDPFLLTIGLLQSLVIIVQFRPTVIVSAGGFVAVPVLWAGWLVGVKCVIFQLDVQQGLANRISTFCAKKIGVALPEEAADFPVGKTEVVGIPIRAEVRAMMKESHSCHDVRKRFHLKQGAPLVLAIGGGTGAQALNDLTRAAMPLLGEKTQLLHVTGRGKMIAVDNEISSAVQERYSAVEFLGPELPALLKCADVVVTRGGMGTLSELAYLGKAVIVVPLPDSPQEFNAAYLEKKKAARYLSQKKLTPLHLAQEIEALLMDEAARRQLEVAIGTIFPSDSTQRACTLIQNVVRE